MDLEFTQRVQACVRCALSVTRQRVVVGSGPANAAVAFVGEAPGRSEDEGGLPFIGRSGRLLFELVAEELELTREQCYVTNVVKCRPPANRTPTRRELSTCEPWWIEQRTMLAATVIVTLGNTATHQVLGTDEAISQLRGRPVRLDDTTVVVPTFHPAAALRGGPSIVTMMRHDLATVAKLLRGGGQ